MRKNTQKTIQTRIALTTLSLVIGFFSSFVFIFTVSASGIAPSDVIALANSAREKEGLSPLSSNAKLVAAAEDKAYDMLKNDYFAHTSPEGVEPWYWIKKADYDYKYAGENLAINYTSANAQHAAWMQSPTHRANILNAHYREIGVATVEGKINGEVSIVTVELFGTQALAVADQSRAIVPLAGQPVVKEAALPEVKGTEIVASPLSAPFAPQLESVITSDAKLSFVWAETHAQTIMVILSERIHMIQARLGNIQWNEVARTTAIVFLLLVVLMGPLAFLYKAMEAIAQTVREKDMHRRESLVRMVLSQAPFGSIHQHMKPGTTLMHDIRPG